MKRWICLLLAALLGCLGIAAAENASLFDVPGLGSALAQEELAAQDLAKMIPVLDSFAHAMDLEGTVAYDPEDPAFVWTELYLLGVNWYTDGQLDAPASDAITVPVEQKIGRAHV